MKTTSNNSTINTRITRYISGEMTNIERLWFENIVTKNKKINRLVQEMKNDWTLTGKILDKKIDTAKAWSNLYQKLETDNLLPQNNAGTIRLLTQGYLRYAAIVTVMLIISGIAAYQYLNPRSVLLTNNSNQNTLITTLPDGSTIYLAKNSTLNYPKRFVGKTREVKLNGEAFFEIAKDANHPFTIDTKAASVKVLGTSFNLKSNSDRDFELKVVEGKVGINLNINTKENIIATAGDMVIANNRRLIKTNQKISSTIKNTMLRLQFQNEPFINIINILNKTYGSNIVIEGNNLKERRITVMFENDISSIINILSVSFNLEIKHEKDGTITLSEKHE